MTQSKDQQIAAMKALDLAVSLANSGKMDAQDIVAQAKFFYRIIMEGF